MGVSSYVKGGLVGLALGFSTACGSLEKAVADETQKTVRLRQLADTLWTKGNKAGSVQLYMKMSRTNEILGKCVEYVKYDPKEEKTNFDKLIYQRHLKKKDRKPVLVLFYHNVDPKTKGKADSSFRLSIIFRKLSQQYASEIRFVAYEAETHPVLRKFTYNSLFNRYNFNRIPSYKMYSPWDALKKETKEKNDGIVKYIDTLRGSPKNSTQISGWVKILSRAWIDSNIANLNGKYVKRLDNTSKFKKKNIN